MIRFYYEITKGFEEELDIVKKINSKTIITHESHEVKLLSIWILQQFKDMIQNSLTTYASGEKYPSQKECKKNNFFTNQSCPLIWDNTISKNVQCIKKVKTKGCFV